VMVAAVRPQPEITLTPNPVEAFAEPIAEPEPVAEVAEVAEVAVAEPAPEPAPQEPVELPRTATPLPLVAVGGLASLLAGLGLGLVRRRGN